MGGTAGGGGMGGMAGGGGMGGMPPTASSCLELQTDHGATESREYLIDVGGTTLTVYCDMDTPPGGWTQLYDQDVAQGYEDPATLWATDLINVDQPNSGHYSILRLTAEFEGASGFELLIDWNDERSDFVHWTQSTNPLVGRGLVNIILQSPTNQLGCTAFGGLGPDNDGSSALDGSTDTCWWWATGTSAPFGAGIPAYLSSGAAGGGLAAMRTRLWVR
jgi:hypothetical protein